MTGLEVRPLTRPLIGRALAIDSLEGAVACLTSAILDALAPLGIRELAMPATPERIWRAINSV